MDVIVAGVLTGVVGGTALVLAEAVRRGEGAAIVNAVASLAVAGVATATAAGFSFEGAWFVAPELAVWAAVAGFLHSVGMLGPYETVWWYDHVTHTVSAALLAALVYAGLLATVGATWSTLAVAAATVGYAFVAGVAWEGLELAARALGEHYDVDPVLVHYGWRDTAYDLVFDVAGAAVVVALDVRLFVQLAAGAPQATRALLAWTTLGFAVAAVVSGGLFIRQAHESR
jgi:hypothetical protein